MKVKQSFFLSDFNKTLFISTDAKISNFVKTRQFGADLFHVDERTDGRTDGRTDTSKLILTFHNSAKASKIFKYP
jgi:hypothetical protein